MAHDPGMSSQRSAAAAGPARRRLFFALWPEADVVSALSDWARQAQALCGGRTMRPDSLHLTLAFLGAVETGRIAELQALLPHGGWQGGTLSLDRYGRFGGPRIVWAGSAQPAPWLDDLHALLWRRLGTAGFSEPDEPFRPHLSLLRNAGLGDLSALSAPPPIVWTPRRLVLMASLPRESGSYYEMLAETELR